MNKIGKIGLDKVQSLNIAVCSTVRDCDKNLEKNIPLMNDLASKFKECQIIVFENDSVDRTKTILKDWSSKSPNVHINCENLGTRTIPQSSPTGVNKYYSKHRISRMVEYRNYYLDKLEKLNFEPDYVLIVDLDVSKIYLEGIFHSFGILDKWDVVTANGYSISPKMRFRYHDSYALVELGDEKIPQTQESILKASNKWSALSTSESLLPVYSAYGGLSIYRYEAIKNLRYRLIENNNRQVEVRCEHFALCQAIRERGFERIYINPMMKLRYQSLSLGLLKKYINRSLD
jgi:hypothetical protein